jgi:hypothetical protein
MSCKLRLMVAATRSAAPSRRPELRIDHDIGGIEGTNRLVDPGRAGDDALDLREGCGVVDHQRASAPSFSRITMRSSLPRGRRRAKAAWGRCRSRRSPPAPASRQERFTVISRARTNWLRRCWRKLPSARSACSAAPLTVPPGPLRACRRDSDLRESSTWRPPRYLRRACRAGRCRTSCRAARVARITRTHRS